MAERHRSKDGTRDTDKIPGVNDQDGGPISHQGRSGGNLDRDVGTQDEGKRATERPAGATRVKGQDKRNHGTEPEQDGDGDG